MNTYVAKEGDRLDNIAFMAYGSIDDAIINAVLEANAHLLERSTLKSGDTVFLPEIQIDDKESDKKALW